MLLWGAASVGMAWVSSPTEFYALRFMLGVFEAGFFPGIVLYLTYWYPAARRASVLSYFFAGVAVAGVLGGLMSGWIMRDMAGVMDMRGWQWMFAIEGAPAIVLAVMAHFYLDDKPSEAQWLERGEKARLAANMADEAPCGAAKHGVGGLLRNPRIYLYSLVYFALTCAALTLSFWMPIMIRDFGVKDVVTISLYTAIPNAIGAVAVILIARLCDRRRQHKQFAAACAIAGAAALSALALHPANIGIVLAILAVATTVIYSALPIFWAIPTATLPPQVRAGGIALISSVGITSGIAGPWAIGQIKTATGNMDNALYVLSALLVLSAAALLIGLRKR
jgi:MFS family permease